MITYDVDLFLKLAEVFPESLNTSRVVEKVEYIPGRFGYEEVKTGYETENLAEDILCTANSTMIKYGKERALAYIESYRPARVRRAELQSFSRNN